MEKNSQTQDRKRLMIYDCLTLRDELDMLEIRFKILDQYVDKFVICEADKTHTNLDKEYSFEVNKKKFEKWEDKIIYIPIQLDDSGLDFSKKDSRYDPTSAAWQFENQQRNALSKGLVNIKDEDRIVLGDVDEIPDFDSLKYAFLNRSWEEIEDPMCLLQNFYYYYFNNRSVGPRDAIWKGSVICSGKFFKRTTPQGLRNNRTDFRKINNGGWHWSFIGGKEMIKRKIQTIAHTEFNEPQYCSDENIDKCLEQGKDLFNRKDMNFSMVDMEEEYPEKVLKILDKYQKFIYTKRKNLNEKEFK